jgi:hypothetical protein
MYNFSIFAVSCMEDSYSTYVTNWHFGVCEEDGYYHNSYKAVTDTVDMVCTFTVRHDRGLCSSGILCSIWWEFLTDILGLLGCPEMSVRYYHYMLRNTLEERRSYLLRSRSLKSCRSNWLAQKPSCPLCCTVLIIHCSYMLHPQIVIIVREFQTL